MARFYDPVIAHFIQPDSIVPTAWNTRGFDRYAYVMNSPVNLNDPSGHFFCQRSRETGQCLTPTQRTEQEGTVFNNSSPVDDYQTTSRSTNTFEDDFTDPLHESLPLPVSSYTGFGDYRGEYQYEPHKGESIWHASIDRKGYKEQPVYAIAPGVVVETGWNSSGPGNYIIIKHEYATEVLYSLYFHLGSTSRENGINVSVGSIVDTNTVIGFVGNSYIGTKDTPCELVPGCSNPYHVHFEVRYENNVNLDTSVKSLMYARDYWAFDSSWSTNFYDLGSIYGYYKNSNEPILPD